MADLRFKYNDKFGLIVTMNNKFFRGKIKTFDRDLGAVVLDDIKEGECIFFPATIERIKILKSKIDINNMLDKLNGWEEELKKLATPEQINEVEDRMKQRV